MNLDTSLFFALNSLAARTPFGDTVIVFLATYLPFLVVAGYGVYLIRRNHGWKERISTFALALFAAGLARVATTAIRYAIPRSRPFVTLTVHKLIAIAATTPSFPSGHASFFFGLSTFVFCKDRKAGIVLMILSTVICAARVAAGIHYPSDILAGAFVGIVAGYFTAFLIFPFVSRRLKF